MTHPTLGAPRPWLPRLRAVGKAALIAVYTLALSEAFVRYLDPQPLMPRYVTGTPWGVRGNIRNANYWHVTPDARVSFHINSEGMRDDREFPFEKPAGTCRIELFGDSFFMGYELDLKRTFAYDLERMLRERGYAVNVLNLSVSGFGTAEMLRTYEAYGRRFAPDLVVFSWHSSDFSDNVAAGLYRLSDGKLVEANSKYLPSVKIQDRLMRVGLYRWIADNSHLYSLARERTSAVIHRIVLTVAQIGDRSKVAEEAPHDDGVNGLGFLTNAYATSLSRALLLHARDEMQADHVGFLVTEIPFRVNSHDFRSSAELLPPELWREIPRATPLAAFLQAVGHGEKIYYERGEGHVTPLGASLLASSTVEDIVKMPNLSSCRRQAEATKG